MTFAIAPMTAEHLPQAAELLDRWYARIRRPRSYGYPYPVGGRGCTALPAEERIAELLKGPSTEAVAARGGRGRLAGYLITAPCDPYENGRTDLHGHPGLALVAHGGHAVHGGEVADVLREMYAAVAERLVARDRLVHHVQLPADDTVAMAWFRLGFGLERIRGAMPVRASGRQPRGVEGLSIRRAGPADLAAVGRMAVDAALYRRQAAVFEPQTEEILAVLRTRYADALADPQCAAFVAMRRGEEAGLVVLTPARPGPFTPEQSAELAEAYVEPSARGEGVSRVLLATALAWAYDRGYRQVTAAWPTASPLAAGHWPKLGFTPVGYRLCRILDPRIGTA
ncbi:GNAT family N-acetyltransferase [Streptomyces sp. RB6PN25]|uniref:GNAT family N-acetyltransferase n=1 Tax=Streptomyces humicola TaxID=2953240 RepID=A0ABT1PQX6_9ACTN|nr:GNAT family N-acetyltransferase [Streptomyces humicola]MCQ4080072.1 GNAT family N-acetyltransferase [Streptomyces humicola]